MGVIKLTKVAVWVWTTSEGAYRKRIARLGPGSRPDLLLGMIESYGLFPFPARGHLGRRIACPVGQVYFARRGESGVWAGEPAGGVVVAMVVFGAAVPSGCFVEPGAGAVEHVVPVRCGAEPCVGGVRGEPATALRG